MRLKSSVARACLTVAVIQLLGIALILLLPLNLKGSAGIAVFEVLNAVCFLPGRFILGVGGPSIRYYGEAALVTWIFYSSILGLILSLRGKSRLQDTGAKPVRGSSMSTKRLVVMLIVTDAVALSLWGVAVYGSAKGDWGIFGTVLIAVDAFVVAMRLWINRNSRSAPVD